METGNNEIVKGVTYFPLSPRVRIHVDYKPFLELPKHLEAEVERVWQEQKKEKNLFNAPLFTFSYCTEYKIFGQFVEYRYFIACQHLPELKKVLNIKPLGVSGLCFSDGNILIGTRNAKLATYGGYKECVPSGSIETRASSHGEVDFFMQIIWELEEEAHVSEKAVKEIHPLGLFYDKEKEIYDIGILIRLDLLASQMNVERSAEYPFLEWISLEEWKASLDRQEAKIVPLSKALWKAYCQMRVSAD